jgi:hypothetical protein
VGHGDCDDYPDARAGLHLALPIATARGLTRRMLCLKWGCSKQHPAIAPLPNRMLTLRRKEETSETRAAD